MFGIPLLCGNFPSSTSTAETIFSLKNIFLFSSGTATSNTAGTAVWSLDVHQYSDIAFFIDNHATDGYTDKNTIAKLWIDHFSVAGISSGTYQLSYKDVQTFGKYVDLEETAITDTLTYTITDGETVDSSIAQLDKYCKSPLTLGWIHKNVKEEFIVTDTSSTISYNGSLLKMVQAPLNTLQPTISMDIHIENALGETFVLPVTFTITLQDEQSSIYDGTFRQDIALDTPFIPE